MVLRILDVMGVKRGKNEDIFFVYRFILGGKIIMVLRNKSN